MDAFDYAEMASVTQEMIEATGRTVQLYKLSPTAAVPDKPWRGPGVSTETDEVETKATFVVPNTSIPTESRGLAFDWVDQELLRRTRHVCIIAALDLPVLDDFKVIHDAARVWKILWGQCLQPGDTRLLYVFGVAE